VQRCVEQVLPIDVQHVEQKGGDSLRSCLAVDPRDGVLERSRPVLGQPERLAVEDGLTDRQFEHSLDDARQGVRDLVEIPRVDADLVRAPVDLDPDSVELPFHRRALEAG